MFVFINSARFNIESIVTEPSIMRLTILLCLSVWSFIIYLLTKGSFDLSDFYHGILVSWYLANMWTINDAVISITSIKTQNPTSMRNGVLIISPCQPLGYRLFFSFLCRLMQLFKTFFIFTYNSTDFPVMKLFAIIVIIQRAFWILFWHPYFLGFFSYLSRSAFSISRLMGIPVFTDISLTSSINFLSIVVLIVSRLILLFGRAIFYPFHVVLYWPNYQ